MSIADDIGPAIKFRSYQMPVFKDRASGLLILHWARQIGKSFTLGCWAVDRLLAKLQSNVEWTVTVLSNSTFDCKIGRAHV